MTYMISCLRSEYSCRHDGMTGHPDGGGIADGVLLLCGLWQRESFAAAERRSAVDADLPNIGGGCGARVFGGGGCGRLAGVEAQGRGRVFPLLLLLLLKGSCCCSCFF